MMLFWFALRYWQTHKGIYVKELREEASKVPIGKSKILTKLAVQYAESSPKVKGDNNKPNGYSISMDGYTGKSFRLRVFQYGGGSIKNGQLTGTQSAGQHVIDVTGWRGILLTLTSYLYLYATGKAFTSYVVPYMLLVGAVILGINDLTT